MLAGDAAQRVRAQRVLVRSARLAERAPAAIDDAEASTVASLRVSARRGRGRTRIWSVPLAREDYAYGFRNGGRRWW